MSMGRTLYWLPRILGILFAAFVSLFALDVFSEGYSIGETVVALAMHLIPTALILLALVLAWRWEWLGACLFFALGLLYVAMVAGQSFDWTVYLVMVGPPLLIGALFLLGWVQKRQQAKT
jgi:hypothetical protein